MRSFFIVSMLVWCASFWFSACTKEEKWSSDPIGLLHFSTDTLSFDTVFSTVGTTTAWLKIYNRGDQNIRLDAVSLESGGKSGFRINLDGVLDVSFSNVEISAGDSMFLFVALTPNRQDSLFPKPVVDAVVFRSGTDRKQIVLQACSQDAVIWHGKRITSDTTLTAGLPFLIYDSLVVAPGATLRIEKGVRLYFHSTAGVVVYGTLKAVGTVEAPIVFRGDRMDNVLPDLPYDFYPGQWNGICLKTNSYNNELDGVCVRGAYWGVKADSSSLSMSKLKITNSVIHNMVNNCLMGSHGVFFVANTQLTNSGGATVSLEGGKSDFVHCTIANYEWLVDKEGPALFLDDSYNDDPLNVGFFNCIVYGNWSSEVLFNGNKKTPNGQQIVFNGCLVKTLESGLIDFASASGCVYSKEPMFLKLGSVGEKYRYDFRIDSLSAARDVAIPVYATDYPMDRNGVSRLNDAGPDVGAYEWLSGK